MERKPKCKECRYARIGFGDPSKGFCVYKRAETKGEEVTYGVDASVVPAVPVDLRAEACEHFEPKVSRKEFIRESF